MRPWVLLLIGTAACSPAAWDTHQQYACSNGNKPIVSNATAGSDDACLALCRDTAGCSPWQLHRASGACWGYAMATELIQNNDYDCGCAGVCAVHPVTRDPGFAKPNDAPLVLLPQDRGDQSPAALDGSPYGLGTRAVLGAAAGIHAELLQVLADADAVRCDAT